MWNGILNIYKEKGYTSHDVVAKLRGIVRQKKIGHTGTLDPDAEGVLPVCLGKATRLCDMLTDQSKTYEAVLLLGKTTDTQDITGQLLEEQEWEPEPDVNRNLPEEEFLRKEEARRVRDCLMCLGEQERTVLLLRDFQELSYEEAARIMKLTPEVVKSRIYRARQKFRKIYEDSGKGDKAEWRR